MERFKSRIGFIEIDGPRKVDYFKSVEEATDGEG